MDLNKVFVIVLAILAIFVIGDAILVILTPPKGDELQACFYYYRNFHALHRI